MAKKFYAVKKGKKIGVFHTWAECKVQVDGYSGAVYKSFSTLEEAKAFVDDRVIESDLLDMEDVLQGHEPAKMVAYVDGSFLKGKPEFSYGAVIGFEGEQYEFCEKIQDSELASMHNVAGEIKGAEFAMKFALEKGCKELYIYHDYEGISKWCRGEWKTNKEGTKAYKAFYDEIKNKIAIHFVKVTGHSGDKYNDIADQLAKRALGID